MTNSELLTLRFDPDARGRVIAGWLSDDRGEHHFAGWLGLLMLLEQARAAVASDHEGGADNDDA